MRSMSEPARLVLLLQHAGSEWEEPGRNHLGEDSPSQMSLGKVQAMPNHLDADRAVTVQLGKGRD